MSDKETDIRGFNQEVIIDRPFSKYRIFLSRIREREFLVNDFLNVIYVIKGSVDIAFNDLVFNVKEEDLYVINPDVCFEIEEREENTLLVIQIRREFMETVIKAEDDFIFHSVMDDSCKEKLKQHMGQLYLKSFDKDWGQQDSDSKVREILLVLEKGCLKQILMEPNSRNNIEDVVYDVAKYIAKNYIHISKNNIKLSDIAHKYDVNYYYLSRYFKELIGDSYTDFLLKMRINKSVDLLLNTDYKIADICERSGFTSMKSMNLSFQKIFNLPPSKIRKAFRDINKSIKESELFKEEATQNFIKSVRLDSSIYMSSDVRRYVDLDLRQDNFPRIEPMENILDLNNIIDISQGLDHFKLILKDMDIDRIVFNIKVVDQHVYMIDRQGGLQLLNDFESNQLINIFKEYSYKVIMVLNYDLPKSDQDYKAQFNQEFMKALYGRLDFICGIMGVNELQNYMFGLRINNMKELLREGYYERVYNSIGAFIDGLDSRLGKRNYNWALYLDDICQYSDLSYYKSLVENMIDADKYILGMTYDGKSCNIESSIDYYLNIMDDFRDFVGGVEVLADFHYDLGQLGLEEKYKKDYAYLYTLELYLRFKHDGYRLYGVNFQDGDRLFDNYIYNPIGIKTNYYYIIGFSRVSGLEILSRDMGVYATRNGGDLVIVFYDDFKEYYKYALDRGQVDYDKELDYRLRVRGIDGFYKLLQLDVDYYNNNQVYRKLDEAYWPYISVEEKKYLEGIYTPDVDIDFIRMKQEFKMSFKRDLLKVKLFRLQKI